MATLREFWTETSLFRPVSWHERLWGCIRWVFGWRPRTMSEIGGELIRDRLNEESFTRQLLFPITPKPEPSPASNLMRIIDDE